MIAFKIKIRKLQANITSEQRYKILKKILTNQIQKYINKIMHDNQVSIPGMQGWKNQSRLYITKNKLKNKNYMTISIDAGKSF